MEIKRHHILVRCSNNKWLHPFLLSDNMCQLRLLPKYWHNKQLIAILTSLVVSAMLSVNTSHTKHTCHLTIIQQMFVCEYVCMYACTYVCMYVMLLLDALHLGRQSFRGSSTTSWPGRLSFMCWQHHVFSSTVPSYVIPVQGIARCYYNCQYYVAILRDIDWQHQVPRHRWIFLLWRFSILLLTVTYELPSYPVRKIFFKPALSMA